MIDPYIQQTQASMYMNPWQGFTSMPGMMSGGPQGYMGVGSISNMQNQFGGLNSGPASSVYGAMYDNPFTTSFAMQRMNLLARPRGAHFAGFQANADNISMGTGAAITSTTMDIGGGLVGGSIGAAVGQMLIPIPGVGAMLGGVVGSSIGSAVGGFAASGYANRAGRQAEVHRSLMGLGNSNSPYGGGFGYSTQDARKVYRGMEDMAINDPYFGVGDIGRILDEGIKSGNIKGTSSVGDIKSKLKNLKETAKSLVEIFGDSDISEIMDTLRRLNGTGLTNSQAIEVSRTMGMAARSMGMKEGDYFNQEMQKAETAKDMGMGTEYSIMRNDANSLLSFKYNKDAAKNFANNDDFSKKLAEFNQHYAQMMNGAAGRTQLGIYNRTTEYGMDVLAEAQATEDTGGRDKFYSLSKKERAAARSKGMAEVMKRVDNGESLVTMAQGFFDNKSMGVAAYRAFISADQRQLAAISSGHAADYGTAPGHDKWMANNKADVVTKSSGWVHDLSHTPTTASDRYVAEVIRGIGSNAVIRGVRNEKQGEKAAEARTASAADTQYRALQTELSSEFGRMVEKLLSHLKSIGKQDLVKTNSLPPEQAAKVLKLASTPEIMKMMSSKGFVDNLSSMFTTGNTGVSIFNNRGIFNQTPNREILEGIGNESRLGHNRIGATADAIETLAMGKSGLWNKENIAEKMDKASGIFDDYYGGKINKKSFRNKLLNINGNLAKDISAFAESSIMKKIDSGQVKDFKKLTMEAMKGNASIFDSGLLTPYEFSMLAEKSRRGIFASVTDIYKKHFGGDDKTKQKGKETKKSTGLWNAIVDHTFGQLPALYDKFGAMVDDPKSKGFWASADRKVGEYLHYVPESLKSAGNRISKTVGDAFDDGKHDYGLVEDMKEIEKLSTDYQKRVITATQALSKVDYKQLKGDINREGLFKGVKTYINNSKITKDMSAGEKTVFEQILRSGRGDKTRTQKSSEQQGLDAIATMSSGTDIVSAMSTFGIHLRGGVNVDQIENFAKMLKQHGGTHILMKRGYTEDDANKLQDTMAKRLEKNKNEIAVTSNMPFYVASAITSDTYNGKFGDIAKSIRENGQIGSAVIDYLGYNKKDRKKIFNAAQILHNKLIKGNYQDLSNAVVGLDNETNFDSLTKKQYNTALVLSRANGLEKVNAEDFAKIGAHEKVTRSAIAIARAVTGEMLSSTGSQARALGMIGLLKKDANNKMRAMTGDEAKEAYAVAIKKDKKHRTYSDKLIIAATDSVINKTNKKLKDISGESIVKELSMVNGLGVSAETMARNINLKGKTGGRAENLLERIDTKLGGLLSLAQRKAGGTDLASVSDVDNANNFSLKIEGVAHNEKAKHSHTTNVTKKAQSNTKPKIKSTPLVGDNKAVEAAIDKLKKEQFTPKKRKADNLKHYKDTMKKLDNIKMSSTKTNKRSYSDGSANVIYYKKPSRGDSNHKAKSIVTKKEYNSTTLEEEYKNSVKKVEAAMAAGHEKNHNIKITHHPIGVEDGGSRAANLGHAQIEKKTGGKNQKRDLTAQTNTLLERIASAAEATRDAIKSSPPLIKPAH